MIQPLHAPLHSKVLGGNEVVMAPVARSVLGLHLNTALCLLQLLCTRQWFQAWAPSDCEWPACLILHMRATSCTTTALECVHPASKLGLG